MKNRIPSPNEVVLFRKRKEPCFGVFVKTVADKTVVFAEEGRELNVSLEKIVLPTGIRIEGNNTQSEKKLMLRDLRNRMEEKKDSVDLETIWACIEKVDGEIAFEDISSLYFGDAEVSAEELMTLFWAVDKNGIYFKRGENGYLPREAEEIKDLIHQRETEKRKTEQKKLAVEWARSVLNGSVFKNDEFDRDVWVDLLKGYVIHLDKFNRSSEAKSFLSEIGLKDIEGAIEFLIKAGEWAEDEDPVMRRFSIREEFPEDVLAEARALVSGDPATDGFEDHTGLEVFSVDDEGTEDIDDALSIEETDDGLIIGIHIAHVASHVEKWSALDSEAARRGETIYLPEKRIHMFPPELVSGRLSLLENTQRASLSLFVTVDDGLNIKKYRFSNSLVNISENMSYERGSRYFENDPSGIKLLKFSEELRKKRVENGAFLIQLPQLKVTVDDTRGIMVEKNFMDTTAHRVVAEMMILMNRLAGRFLKENGIPAVYRSQPEEISDDARTLDRDDPLYALNVIKYLRAPRVGLDPAPHMSLGIDYYTQITSPIRRYSDLVMQRQISSHIVSGEPVYSEEELEDLYPKIEIGVREKRTVERARQRYWLYKYLKTLEGSELPATVSSASDSKTSVYLKDYLFETQIAMDTEKLPAEGEYVKVLVKNVDPIRGKLVLSLR